MDHQKDTGRQFKQLATEVKMKKRKIEDGKGENRERENPEETLAQKPF